MQVAKHAAANVAPRFTLSLPMRYRLEGQLSWRPGKTVNVSSSGLLFIAQEPLPRGAKIEVEISMSSANLKPTRVHAVSEVLRQGSAEQPMLTTVHHVKSHTVDGDFSTF